MTNFRVPMDDDQFQAVLEAARYADSSFITTNLLDLALSYKHSADQEWEWRMEDET